jgi:hypothetical protein
MSLAHQFSSPVVCTLCVEDLQHCHGTAIVTDFSHVCSDDPDCTVSVDEHWYVDAEDD